MQNSVPKGQGGMVAVLGSKINVIEKILDDYKKYLMLKLQTIILKVKWC